MSSCGLSSIYSKLGPLVPRPPGKIAGKFPRNISESAREISRRAPGKFLGMKMLRELVWITIILSRMTQVANTTGRFLCVCPWQVFDSLSSSLDTEAELQVLLGLLPESKGGVGLLALGLLSTDARCVLLCKYRISHHTFHGRYQYIAQY